MRKKTHDRHTPYYEEFRARSASNLLDVDSLRSVAAWPFIHGFLFVALALFPIVNPLGMSAIFMSYTEGLDDATIVRLARRVAINAFFLTAASFVAGPLLLTFFGLSVAAVRLGGGLVLAYAGWKLLNQGQEDPAHRAPAASAEAIVSGAFYPLTLPLTIGPGSIAVMVTLGSSMLFGTTISLWDAGGAIVGLAAVSAVTYVCYSQAEHILRKLGASGVNVLLRLSAFVLLCIGVQIAVEPDTMRSLAQVELRRRSRWRFARGWAAVRAASPPAPAHVLRIAYAGDPGSLVPLIAVDQEIIATATLFCQTLVGLSARESRRPDSGDAHTVAAERRRFARRDADRLPLAPRRALRRRRRNDVGRRRVHVSRDLRSAQPVRRRSSRIAGSHRWNARPVHGRRSVARAVERGRSRALRAGRLRIRYFSQARVCRNESRRHAVGGCPVRNRTLPGEGVAPRRPHRLRAESVLPSATEASRDRDADRSESRFELRRRCVREPSTSAPSRPRTSSRRPAFRAFA